MFKSQTKLTTRKAHIISRDFHLEDKKKIEMINALTFVVLSHFHIVSMVLSLKSIFPPFCQKRL